MKHQPMRFLTKVQTRYLVEVRAEALPETHRGGFDPQNVSLSDLTGALVVCEKQSKNPTLKAKCGATLDRLYQLGGFALPRKDDLLYPDSKEVKYLERKDWKSIILFSAPKYVDPESLFRNGNAKPKQPRGYLLHQPWDLTTISHILYGYKEYYLLNKWKEGKASPVITINGELWDGWHRTALAYLLDVEVPAVDIKL